MAQQLQQNKVFPYSNIRHILCHQRGLVVTGYTSNKPYDLNRLTCPLLHKQQQISSTYHWMSPVADDFNDVSTRSIKKEVTPLIKANGQTTVLIHSRKKAYYSLTHVLRTMVLTNSVQITRYTSDIFHNNKRYCVHLHLVWQTTSFVQHSSHAATLSYCCLV